jgi:hypothetical protein
VEPQKATRLLIFFFIFFTKYITNNSALSEAPIPFYSIQPKMEKKKRQLRYDCGLVETGMRAQYGQKILRAKPSDTLLLVLVSSP